MLAGWLRVVAVVIVCQCRAASTLRVDLRLCCSLVSETDWRGSSVLPPRCWRALTHARDSWTCITREKAIRGGRARMDLRARVLAGLLL